MAGKNDPAVKSTESTINDEMVRDYLIENNDFLQRNPEMLDHLHISHASGSAISLVEKQVGILRERNIEMRRRLSTLTTNARDNDKLYEQTRSLVLNLLGAKSSAELQNAFVDSMKNDFQAEHASMILFGDPENGDRNVGCYRLTQLWNAVHPMGEEYPEEQQKKELSVFAFWNPPMSHIGLHIAKATAMGKPLEVAFACQLDPAIHLAAATGVPFGQDEFQFAGGLRDEAVELVQCETVDLQVPATAEFVIEGVFIPNSETTIGNHSIHN